MLSPAVLVTTTTELAYSLPPAARRPAAAVVVAASMLLTGAFHEDGLADTADALGGAFDRPKLFAILKECAMLLALALARGATRS